MSIETDFMNRLTAITQPVKTAAPAAPRVDDAVAEKIAGMPLDAIVAHPTTIAAFEARLAERGHEIADAAALVG